MLQLVWTGQFVGRHWKKEHSRCKTSGGAILVVLDVLVYSHDCKYPSFNWYNYVERQILTLLHLYTNFSPHRKHHRLGPLTVLRVYSMMLYSYIILMMLVLKIPQMLMWLVQIPRRLPYLSTCAVMLLVYLTTTRTFPGTTRGRVMRLW